MNHIIISDNLKKVLVKINGKIAKILLDIDSESDINYLDVSNTDPFRISYITNDRIEQLKEEYKDKNIGELVWKKRRYHAKPGKIITKLLGEKTSSVDIEKFTNLYKAIIEKSSTQFRILNGKEMAKFYHYSFYEEVSGSLGQSCMKYDQSQRLLDLYTNNTNIRMLVVHSKNDVDKIVARALLWETVDGHKIMDRVYTTDQYYESIFNEWAKEHKYYRKRTNTWYDTINFIDSNDNQIEIKSHIIIENYRNILYPYLDTFKWLDYSNGKLYNYLPTNLPNYNNIIVLIKTDGSVEGYNSLLFDDLDRVYNHKSEMVYVDYMNFYTNKNNIVFSKIYNGFIIKTHYEYIKEIDDVIFNKKYSVNNKKILKNVINTVKKMKDKGDLSYSKFKYYQSVVEILKKNYETTN